MTEKNTEYMIARRSTILAALQRTTERIVELPYLKDKEVARTLPETRRYTEIHFGQALQHEREIQQKLLDVLGGKR